MTNTIAVFILMPLLVVLTSNYGGVGAAFIWGVINFTYIIIVIPIFHRRYLKAEMWRWYFQDIGLPMVASLVVASVLRAFLVMPGGGFMLLLYIIAVSIATLGAALLVMPAVHSWARRQYISFIGAT